MTCACVSHDAEECAWIRAGRPSTKRWTAEKCECACHKPYYRDDDEPDDDEPDDDRIEDSLRELMDYERRNYLGDV